MEIKCNRLASYHNAHLKRQSIIMHSGLTYRVLMHSGLTYRVLMHSGLTYRVLMHSGLKNRVLMHSGLTYCVLMHSGLNKYILVLRIKLLHVKLTMHSVHVDNLGFSGIFPEKTKITKKR